MRRWSVLVVCGMAFACPRSLASQEDTASAPRWVRHFASASANMLLSGFTAGVIQEIKGGSFRDGFTRGALGGLIIYGGKRIAVDLAPGAGLIGREVAAVGASVVRNAADGIGSFDRLVLPVGIVRVYWTRAPARQWNVKIDALAAGWTIYGIMERELDFDVGKSLSSGMAIFETRNRILEFGEGDHAGGVTNAGVIYLSHIPLWGRERLDRSFAHERVHALQMDQMFVTLSDPFDDALLTRLPLGKHANQWVDINLATEFLRLLNVVIKKHSDRPWETEAIYLTR